MHKLFSPCLVALLASGVVAQADGTPQSLKSQFSGTPAAGQKAGTERWVVHFKSRPFDLSAFQAEMHGDKNPDKVDAIVADLKKKTQAHQAQFVKDIEALGGTVTHQYWIVNCAAFEIAPKHLAAIKKLPNVDFLQPDEECFPHIKTATNANNHNSDALTARGIRGSGVTAGVADTGHDINMGGTGQPHIIYSTNGNKAVSRLIGNVKLGAAAYDDVHGHGTGVDSIVAGYRWRHSAADHGHANLARIWGVSIANNTGGGTTLAIEAAAYQNFAANAARNAIVASNLSYSGSSNPLSVEQKAMDTAALSADIVNCTSAGNSGTRVSSSLCNINGLSVAAVNENSKTLASFSSRGIQGGRIFPNIAANGVSTDMARRNSETSTWIASGTSMSSPQVCGAVTLIRGANRRLRADETRAIMLASSFASPGTGNNMTVGPGAGYLRDDWAYATAMNAAAHGRATLTNTTKIWRRSINVVRGRTTQIAIAWHRLNVNLTSWSNLELRLKRGATVVASSLTRFNTEEFLRYSASATETLVIEVTLNGSVVGGTSQPFGWATYVDNSVASSYVLYGTGCPGSGLKPAGGPISPKAYASKWGESANYFPHGRANMRYQQMHSKADFPAVNTIRGLAFRLDERFGGPAGTKRVTIKMGYAKTTVATMSRSYAANPNGAMTTIFGPGNISWPAHSGGNRNLADFKVKYPSSRNFIYIASRGDLLWEFVNHSTSSTIHYFDWARNAANTARRIWAFSQTATTGSIDSVRGALVTQFMGVGGKGAIPQLTNSGKPIIGTTMRVNLSAAKPSAPALFGLGGGRTNILLPGTTCRIYTLPTIIVGVATNTSGAASVGLLVPNSTGLLGVRFNNQYFVIDTGVNPYNLALTNGGEGTIGNR